MGESRDRLVRDIHERMAVLPDNAAAEDWIRAVLAALDGAGGRRKWRIYKAPGEMLETLPTGRVVPGHGGCVEGPDTEGEWIEVVEAGGRQDGPAANVSVVGAGGTPPLQCTETV